jgi:hypothetical protein
MENISDVVDQILARQHFEHGDTPGDGWSIVADRSLGSRPWVQVRRMRFLSTGHG